MRIGIDLGGTKIEGIALDEAGRTLLRQRVPAPRGDYEHTLAAIADLVHAIEHTTAQRGTVGIGIPGTLSPATGLVKNANSTWLNGHTLREDLERRLDRPLRFANDANCFALSEATDGAAAGAAVVFGVILGTGTGGGVVVDGRTLIGANAIGGEWGHNPLPDPQPDEWPGLPCYCGRRGCIETVLSGPALERRYLTLSGEAVGAAEIATRASAGEPHAAHCLERYIDAAARALGSIINVLDPDVVVLGGGVSNIATLYSAIPARWSRYVFSDVVSTRLVQAVHGDSSGVRGAAWLWPHPASR